MVYTDKNFTKKHSILLDPFGMDHSLWVKKWALLKEIAAAPDTSPKLLPGFFKENIPTETTKEEKSIWWAFWAAQAWPTFKLKNQDTITMKGHFPQKIQVPQKEKIGFRFRKEGQFLSSYDLVLQTMRSSFPLVNQKVQRGFRLLKISSPAHNPLTFGKHLI